MSAQDAAGKLAGAAERSDLNNDLDFWITPDGRL